MSEIELTSVNVKTDESKLFETPVNLPEEVRSRLIAAPLFFLMSSFLI